MSQKIEFSTSSNGDRWFLDRDPATQVQFVIHEANLPSGGAVTRFAVEDFLKIDRGSPQHSGLLKVLDSFEPPNSSAEATS